MTSNDKVVALRDGFNNIAVGQFTPEHVKIRMNMMGELLTELLAYRQRESFVKPIHANHTVLPAARA